LIAGLWAAAVAIQSAFPRPPFDLEAYLLRHVPPLHFDAYRHLNDLITPPLSAILVSWLSASIALLVARRYPLLLVNVLGPVVAAAMVIPSIDFTDPEWFTVGAVITIGCLVGLVVTGGCWVRDRFRTRRAAKIQE